MSAVETTPATIQAGTGGAAKAAASKLTDHFDSFLSLLTTQLQNQDPLSPMDTETFTQQLVQFTSVEQSIKANSNLEQLIGLVRGTSRTSALGYLGTTVQAVSDQVALGKDGPAAIGYELPAEAASLSVKIYDQAGKLVAETRGPTAAGAHWIAWDGSAADGGRLPAGTYRVAVAAVSASGGSLDVTQTVRGTVDAIDPSSDPPVLSVGGIDVALPAVTAIARPH
ncbi:flagellar hook assembly protein FlgD [Geminicoccus roseus]|uniref:flagellar hook assembly protein FlgD n=1 Tax=Geminicoccus roseus TaxID=404900 RepID=UPI0003F8AACF|nr:flagellar hook assembly protein FlgD [Geminicoccus roseus]